MAADQRTVSRERISPACAWNICTQWLCLLQPGSETQTINGGQMVERRGRMVGELLGLAMARLHTHTHTHTHTTLFNFFGGRGTNLEGAQMCSDWHFLMRRDELQRWAQPVQVLPPFLTTHSLSLSCHPLFSPSSVVSTCSPSSSPRLLTDVGSSCISQLEP